MIVLQSDTHNNKIIAKQYEYRVITISLNEILTHYVSTIRKTYRNVIDKYLNKIASVKINPHSQCNFETKIV